jgi:hypothetical protein
MRMLARRLSCADRHELGICLRSLVGAVALWLAFSHQVSANRERVAESCASLPLPSVTFDIFHSPPVGPVAVESDELTRIAAAANTPSEERQIHPSVLLTTRLSFEVIVQEVISPLGGGFCPIDVAIRIGHVARRIYIARGVQRSSCLSRILVDHERKHARADDEALDASVAASEGQLRRAITRAATISGITPKAALHEFQARVSGIMMDFVREFVASHETTLRTVNSAAEIERLRTTCRGEI